MYEGVDLLVSLGNKGKDGPRYGSALAHGVGGDVACVFVQTATCGEEGSGLLPVSRERSGHDSTASKTFTVM